MNRIHYFVKSGMLRLGFKDDKRGQTSDIRDSSQNQILLQAPCAGCSVDTNIKVNRSRAVKVDALMASSRPAHGGGDRR